MTTLTALKQTLSASKLDVLTPNQMLIVQGGKSKKGSKKKSNKGSKGGRGSHGGHGGHGGGYGGGCGCSCGW